MKQNDWRSPTHSQECDLKLSNGEVQCPFAAMGMIYYFSVSSLPPSPQQSISFYFCSTFPYMQFESSFNAKHIKGSINWRRLLRGRTRAHVSRELNPLMISTTAFTATSMRTKLRSLEDYFLSAPTNVCFFFFFFLKTKQQQQLALLWS